MRARYASLIILICLAVAQTATGTTKARKPAAAKKAVVSTAKTLDSLKMVEGDEQTNEVRALKTELMVTRTEMKAIQQAQALLKKHKGTNLEPELQFRLAELYMRRAKSARFFEINRQSETVVKLAPKVVANANSRKYVESAVETYEYIQHKFPRFRSIDLVVFNNAFARQSLGQEKEAERLYWSLIKNFSNSALVPDCHLAIGEINFDRNNFSFALEHFNAIAKYPESRVYPYGLYKAAWSHYNMHDAVAALKKLEEVVSYGQYVSKNKIESRLDLRKEALGDMTIVYEDVLPAHQAYAYFKKQAGELDVAPIILKLAKIYERHSRYSERQVVLNDFIKNLPESPMLAEIHGELIWNYDAMKKKDLAVQQMDQLARVCNGEGGWLRKQPEGTKQTCLTELNDIALRLSSRWLKIWKKTPAIAADFADAAEKAFEIYLRDSGASKEVTEARFAYAELLFQRGKFRLASQEYSKVSEAKTSTATIKHDSAYAAVLSYEKSVGDKWSDGDERNFQQLVKSYVDGNKNGQYRLDLEFKLALIAYDKERFAEAGPVFMRLGREFGKTEKGQKAQDLYLDILNLKKDFKGLKEYSKSLMVGGLEPARKEKLQKIHEQAYFMQVQAMEDAKDYPAAITLYKEFAESNPESELAEKAWWNAVQLNYKILDFNTGAQDCVAFADKFPKSKNAMDALLKAAQSFESMGKLAEAADVLGRIAKLEPKNAVKWNGLAADFFLLSGQTARAKTLLTELRKSDVAEVRAQSLDKLLLLERTSGGGGYREILGLIAASGVQPQSALARVELIEETLKQGKDADAFNEAKKIIGQGDAPMAAKSRARLVQAKVLEKEFLNTSVKARAEKVATVLAIKTEKLEKAQQALQQAIKYGDAGVTVEAMRRLAGCYSHFVDSLKHMPIPKGISGEDEAAFRDELAKLTIPLEEKTIDSLQDGIRAAKRLRIENNFVVEMRQELKKMNMPVPSNPELELSEPAPALPTWAGVNP